MRWMGRTRKCRLGWTGAAALGIGAVTACASGSPDISAGPDALDPTEEIFVPAHPEPPTHYGGAGAPALAPDPYRAPLIQAAAERSLATGRKPPAHDPRLSRVAQTLALGTRGLQTPPQALVRFALAREGLVEQDVAVTVLRTPPPFTPAAVEGVRAPLTEVLALPGPLRMGVGSRVELGLFRVVVMVVAETRARFEPFPRRLEPGEAITVRGTLERHLGTPSAFVTRPDGSVQRLAVALTADRSFAITLRCPPDPSEQRFELMGEGLEGPVVAANVPLYCGVPPVDRLRLRLQSSRARFPSDANSAEEELLQLLNETRRQAGLSALETHSGATAVARAHSVDMRDHGFAGHRSPTTGMLSDRLRKARIRVPWAGENIARSSSAREIHEGLMASPAHRSAILAPHATHVGIGVSLETERSHEPWVYATQVFLQLRNVSLTPEPRTDASSAPSRVLIVTDEKNVARCRFTGLLRVRQRSAQPRPKLAYRALRQRARKTGANTVHVTWEKTGPYQVAAGAFYDCVSSE